MPDRRNGGNNLAEYLGLDREKEGAFTRLCKDNDISNVALFGSYSRGEHTGKSDIDLLVSFSKRKSLLEQIRIEREFSEILEAKVDMVTEKSVSPYLIDRIKKEAKPIYHER